MIFSKIVGGITKQRQSERQAELYRNLIRHEAKIGGQLFGPVKPGSRREFFCLDENTWVWHEEWVDQNGQNRMRTTRYDVRPNGIMKSQNGQYKPLTEEEADHLYKAAVLYRDRIKKELYSFAV